ncbi:hypothetical protein [Hugenholtzia roseola]|uniref:hypothetical protein n=1 Tax=Hugenholtzia roseola TaxID=1002 RepID=UPI0003F8AB05|nr:hypothetical protein [Hugenholtzia roseola]
MKTSPTNLPFLGIASHTWRLTFLLLFSLALFGLSPMAKAQKKLNDPLSKPAIWAKLKANPNQLGLWEEYLGKKLEAMSAEEKNQMLTWQDELALLALASNEIVVSVSATTNQDDEYFIYELQAQEWKNMQEVVMNPSDEMTHLKQNVDENFAILEDLFAETFEEYGETYVYYADKYPTKNYSQTAWIEEQEAKIRSFKEKELDDIKARIIKK